MASSSITNSLGTVSNGKVTFGSGSSAVTVDLKEGMIGCFSGTTVFTSENTGVIRAEKSLVPGVVLYWLCKIGDIEYRFTKDGHCVTDASNVNTHQLYIVNSTITLGEGSFIATRSSGEDTEQITIDSLNVRDQFAIAALQALINRFSDPINCDIASVKFITNKAYDYANAMLFSSSEARAADAEDEEGEGASEGTIDIVPTTLTTNTEKLLNNIYRTLEATKVAEKTINVKTVTPTLKVDNPENETFDITGGGGGSAPAGMEIVNITEPIATLTAQTNKYYVLSSVATLAITLPTPTSSSVSECVFFVDAGAAPNITFISGSSSLYFADSYEINALHKYEINALCNGSAWLIASVLLEEQE